MNAWTAADSAELDVLVWELTGGWFEHRDRCDRCSAWTERGPDSTPCPHVATAIRIVLDWRDARALLSRAEALRIDQAVYRMRVEAA